MWKHTRCVSRAGRSRRSPGIWGWNCEGDPEDTENAKLVFRGSEKPIAVPDAVPANLAGTGTEGGASGSSEAPPAE